MKLVLKVHLVALRDKVITMTPISDNTNRKHLSRLIARKSPSRS